MTTKHEQLRCPECNEKLRWYRPEIVPPMRLETSARCDGCCRIYGAQAILGQGTSDYTIVLQELKQP